MALPQEPAKQATLCALEWQSCELQKETCCQSLPATMLVAYGNSSASGFNAQCACAPVSFGKLSQNELEEKCLQMKATCRSPRVVPLDQLERSESKADQADCASSVHFTVEVPRSFGDEKGTPCLLRFQVYHSNEEEKTIDLMIGEHRSILPGSTHGRWMWVERPFLAPSRHMEMKTLGEDPVRIHLWGGHIIRSEEIAPEVKGIDSSGGNAIAKPDQEIC
eukprot:g12143.t1